MGFRHYFSVYSIREARNNEDNLKLNGMHEFLFCADDLRRGDINP